MLLPILAQAPVNLRKFRHVPATLMKSRGLQTPPVASAAAALGVGLVHPIDRPKLQRQSQTHLLRPAENLETLSPAPLEQSFPFLIVDELHLLQSVVTLRRRLHLQLCSSHPLPRPQPQLRTPTTLRKLLTPM